MLSTIMRVCVSFAETIYTADVRGEEQPFVRRQFPVGHYRRRRPGCVRHGSPDRPTPRGDCGPYARGTEAGARRSQYEHNEQGKNS